MTASPGQALFLRADPADPGLVRLRAALSRTLAGIGPVRFASLFLDAPAALPASIAAGLRGVLDEIGGLAPDAEVTWHGPRATSAALAALGATRRSLPTPPAACRRHPNLPLAIELGRADLPGPPDDAWLKRLRAAGVVHLGLRGPRFPAGWVGRLDRLARSHGFVRYEALHWALPGHEARWLLDARRGGAIMGLGPRAYGRWPVAAGWCWWRCAPPASWCRKVDRGGDGRGRSHLLAAGERALELAIDGLRLAEGIAPAEIEAEARVARAAWLDHQALAELLAAGRLHARADRLVPADPGDADALARELLRWPA